MASREMEDKQLAKQVLCNFHFTKGDVWFKLSGLSTTNQEC